MEGEKLALVAITKGGARMLPKIKAILPKADAFVPLKFNDEAPFAKAFEKPLKLLLADLWTSYRGIIAVVSLGALVRSMAPLLKDKHTDPAVLAIDDTGRFVISVLSGHIGGANELSRAIALKLDATAVITTASDSLGTIGVDILGRDFGWVVEDFGNVTSVSASVVNEEPIGVWQEAGEPLTIIHKKPLPKNIRVFPSLESLIKAPLRACLIITDRLVDLPKNLEEKTVIYRPKSLVLGLGCDRGVSLEEIEGLVLETLKTHGLSILSVRSIATIENRKEEPAIVGFAQKSGLPLFTFAKEELNRIKDVPNPSTMAMKYVGVIGVAEPSAILGSNYGDLIVPKVKSNKATLAIARVRTPNNKEKGA